MAKRQVDCSEPTHRNTCNRAMLPICYYRESLFNIRYKVFDDVVFKAILRSLSRVGVVRRTSFGHDEHPTRGELRNVGIVRPSTKIFASAMQKIDCCKLSSAGNRCREQHAVRHRTV